MDKNWDYLTYNFKQLGKKPENIHQSLGSRGREIFPKTLKKIENINMPKSLLKKIVRNNFGIS